MSTGGYFDFIIDKGTFDAILVEGSISSMLTDIYRLLRKGGIYTLISINEQDILEPLLSMKPLGFEVLFHRVDESLYKKGCIAICEKVNNSPSRLNVDALILTEKEILDEKFKLTQPLFSAEQEIKLREKFRNIGDDSLKIDIVHSLMFGDGPILLEYGLDLFMNDLENFPLEKEGFLSVEEAVRFLKEMQ